MNLGENPALTEEVKSDNELKTWLVNYVGEKMNPEDDQVTVEMVIETLSEDFPEFLMAFAEENWIRGYHQALNDVEVGRNIVEENEKEDVKQKTCKLCEKTE